MELEFEAIWGEFTLKPWEKERQRKVFQALNKHKVAKEQELNASKVVELTEEEKKARYERQLELDRKREAELRAKE